MKSQNLTTKGPIARARKAGQVKLLDHFEKSNCRAPAATAEIGESSAGRIVNTTATRVWQY
jgi:hypothetical protein